MEVNIENNESRKKLIFVVITIILLISGIAITFKIQNDKKIELEKQRQQLQEEINSHYGKYVKSNKVAPLYKLVDSNYKEVGSISKDQEISLQDAEISYVDEYFKVNGFNNQYYVYYKDVDIIEEFSKYSDRYKKYIVWNKNIVTKNITNFYDKDNNLLYTINNSFDLPIIINKEDVYGVEFNNRLVYVKSEDVLELKDNQNTTLSNTSGVAVLNYHFFYDETKASERDDCNQAICHSKSMFASHLEYIKNNNIFTLTMDEFEMYMYKEINLPKSVLITIDDGWRMDIGVEMLEEYKLNGTVFLITSWFKEISFLNSKEYVEYHSHGDKLHDKGVCPGGQGGAIKCLNKAKLLEDLTLSRKKLGDSTAFAYPFYEYNNYSINTLKEAGFTLAFIGGYKKATPDVDKFQIPRYPINKNTSVDQLKKYIG